MGKWDYSAVHGLNKYIWSKLKTELGWQESHYNGLVPITTPQQQPEFNAIDRPYIVYGFSPQATGPDWLLEGEIIAYTVFSTQSSDIRQAVNVIKAALNRFDESAKDVNAYIKANGTVDNKAFDYKSIRITSATGPEPSLSEGGRQDGAIVVSVMYTHSDPATGRSIRY